MAPSARTRVVLTHISAFALNAATASAIIAPLAFSSLHASAQNAPAAADEQGTYVGVVSGDDVYVRSGAGNSYYPFFKIHRGDLVKVTGESYGFARIALVGPAFNEGFGYIKQAKADAPRIRLDGGGRSGVTLGRVDVIAPNLEANNLPKDSWKVLVRLDADKPLTVLDSTDLGADMLYKVALPAEATGWVNAQFVPRATAEESEMFQNMLAGKTGAAAPPAASPSVPSNAKPPENAVANTPVNQPVTADPVPLPGDQVAETPAPPATELVAINETPATAPATQPDKPREPTFNDLEAAFKRLQAEPKETAELAPMRDMYVALAARNPTDSRLQSYTSTRIKQLDIWETLQQKKLEIAGISERMKMSSEEAEAVRRALERSAEYTAVGRVASSTIYDGASLPKLFRLQDPATGRTIAYLKPDADYALANRIDIIVGIVGDKAYDESLRLNIITPRRIDVLSPEGKPAAAPASVAGAKTDTEDK